MRNILLILLLTIIISTDISAQGNPGLKFFPMQVGNLYVFDYSNSNGVTSISTLKITDSLLYHGTILYYFQSEVSFGFSSGWHRIDSISGNLYRLDSNNSCLSILPGEIRLDSLNANYNDQFYSCGAASFPTRCHKFDSLSYFNNQYHRKGFLFIVSAGGHSSGSSREYLENIGPSFYSSSSNGSTGGFSQRCTLKGCKVNGIIYGDTSLTNIQTTSTEIPEEYSLSQNFPNPFNPSTTISFSLPKAGFVSLKVYSILGEEVKSLVNQQLNAGSYNFDFDAGDLSSGMYIYTLRSGDFTETKKMMLVK